MDFGRTTLSTLSPSVGKLQNLTQLYLNDNVLAELPDELGNCNKLEYINADRNKLTALPASIGRMSSLKWLRLNNNQLASLPADLSGLATNLRRLYLKGNPLPDPEKARIKAALPKCEVIF
jgi:Leucine-rich repeat (LRR) protein